MSEHHELKAALRLLKASGFPSPRAYRAGGKIILGYSPEKIMAIADQIALINSTADALNADAAAAQAEIASLQAAAGADNPDLATAIAKLQAAAATVHALAAPTAPAAEVTITPTP